MTTTLGEALAEAAKCSTKGLRILDRRERPTWMPWPEVQARALAVCGRLQALGIRPGQRVALVYPTTPDFFDAFFGILLAGAVPTPLYPPVRLGRLDEYHRRTARMLELADAKLVLTDRTVRRVLGQAIALGRPPLGCLTLDELPVGEPTEVRVAPDHLGLVQFSSGTTVDPKPVALSHRAILAQGRLIEDAIASTFPEVDGLVHSGCSWLPLYHDMGLIGCVVPALLHPGSLTLIRPEVFVTRPAVWLRALSRYGATVSTAPNFAYALCVDRIEDSELEGIDLSRWLVAMNGAEPVAPDTLRAFLDRFGAWGLRPEALSPVYGLSEASLAVTFTPFDRPFETARFDREALAADGEAVVAADGVELVSVGRPLPSFELEVREDGEVLGANRVGTVWTRGPSLMEGYLEDPEATARSLVEGWLDTGDRGFVHEGGLYLTGREKDVLILRGRNHAPHEVEQAVDQIPGVRTGCAAAVSYRPEGAPTEKLVLFVEHTREVQRGEREALPERCTRAVRQVAGLNVDEVVTLAPGTLPRTSSGKIRRGEALRRHLAGELRAPDDIGPIKLVGAMLRSSWALARTRR